MVNWTRAVTVHPFLNAYANANKMKERKEAKNIKTTSTKSALKENNEGWAVLFLSESGNSDLEKISVRSMSPSSIWWLKNLSPITSTMTIMKNS